MKRKRGDVGSDSGDDDGYTGTTSPAAENRIQEAFKTNWREYNKQLFHFKKFPSKKEIIIYTKRCITTDLNVTADDEKEFLQHLLARHSKEIVREFKVSRSMRCNTIRNNFVALFEISHSIVTLTMVNEDFNATVADLKNTWYTDMTKVVRIMQKAYGAMPTLIDGEYKHPFTNEAVHVFSDFTASDYYFYKLVIEEYLQGNGVAENTSLKFISDDSMTWPPPEWKDQITEQILQDDEATQFYELKKELEDKEKKEEAGEEGAKEEEDKEKVHVIKRYVRPTQRGIDDLFRRSRSRTKKKKIKLQPKKSQLHQAAVNEEKG